MTGALGDGTADGTAGAVSLRGVYIVGDGDGDGVSPNSTLVSDLTVAPEIVRGTVVGIGVSTGVPEGVEVLVGSPPQPVRKTMKAAMKKGQKEMSLKLAEFVI